MNYKCACCGETHDALPDLAFNLPALAQTIPEEARITRVRLTPELCVIDNEHHFVRSVLEIPIHGQPLSFGIGVWISQKAENFQIYEQHPDSSEIGPFFGWLSNDFRFGGQSTLHLKSLLHFQGGTLRPRVELETTNHPLSVAQREGMTIDQVWAFVHQHVESSPE